MSVQITTRFELPSSGDVTQAILDMVAARPDGTRFVFDAGRYLIDSSLLFDNRHGLTFEGTDAVFYATQKGPRPGPNAGSDRRHWWFTNCSDITLRGLRVESTNTVMDQQAGFATYDKWYEFEHAFAFHAISGLLVEDCSSYGTWGDGLYVGNGASDDVTVRRLKVEWNGRQGVSLVRVEGALLDELNIANTRRTGCDFEPGTTTSIVNNVEVRNSYINGYSGFPVAAGGNGIVNNMFIHNNKWKGPWGDIFCKPTGPAIRRSGWRVEDNESLSQFGSPVAALRFTQTDDVSIKRNKFPIATSQSRKVVRFENCQGTLEVMDNDFRPGGCIIENVTSAPVIDTGNQKVCP